MGTGMGMGMGMGMGAKAAEAAAADPFPGGNSSSFVILSVSVAGILAISLLLLTYYLFLTRCAASWRHNNQLDDVAHQRYVVYSPRLERRRRGLEEAAIRRIPTLRYSHHDKAAAVASECAVCLGEFGEGERLRRLPACLHAFHIDCIDAWLHATANCPLCRADVVADHLVIDIASPPGGDTAEVPAAARVAAMSMGDECIDHERPCRGVQQQPMRRSLSLDSCSDKHLYLALQSALRRQQHHSALLPGEEEEEEGAKFGESSAAAGSPAAAASGGRRLRRSFFSFSHGRSSRSAILPV